MVKGIPKSAERLHVEHEILDHGWVIVAGQPDRTIGAARSLIFNAAGSLELGGQIYTETQGNEVLGYVPTIVDNDWEKELPEGWTHV